MLTSQTSPPPHVLYSSCQSHGAPAVPPTEAQVPLGSHQSGAAQSVSISHVWPSVWARPQVCENDAASPTQARPTRHCVTDQHSLPAPRPSSQTAHPPLAAQCQLSHCAPLVQLL